MNKRAAVIGGGIAGLSCAYSLKKVGLDVTLFEKEDQTGGVMRSVQEEGFLVEMGPSTILLKDKRIESFFEELGLETIFANEKSRNRFILKKGKPVPLPKSLFSALSTNLLSIRGKLRILKEPFIPAGSKERTVAEFFSERVGNEVLDTFVNPFIAGTYAGDPGQLSLRHAFPQLHDLEQSSGSIMKGVWKNRKEKNPHKRKREIISFKNGLQDLPIKLEEKLASSILTGSTVTEIISEKGEYSIRYAQNGQAKTKNFNSVIVAAEAWRLSEIHMNDGFARLSQQVKDIPYPPVAVLSFGFKRENIPHALDGFGVLVPSQEKRNILGVLFTSSIFPQRAPRGMALLTVFMGGATQSNLVLDKADVIEVMAKKELEGILGVRGRPVFFKQKIWPKSIPQTILGYDRYLDELQQFETNHPGFFFTGNYRAGISIPDTILNGLSTAGKSIKFLQRGKA